MYGETIYGRHTVQNMSLNQSFIFDFSEYSHWLQGTKIKYKLHYDWCKGRRLTAATLHTSCSEGK